VRLAVVHAVRDVALVHFRREMTTAEALDAVRPFGLELGLDDFDGRWSGDYRFAFLAQGY
jgi:hypothetical protein